MSYDDVIYEILKDYPGFGFAQCMSMPKRIEKPLFQYKETDYKFLKRIASQLGLELISDIINLTNMFYFGKPTGKAYIVNDDVNYNAVKDLDKYHKISALNGNLHDTDYFYYEVYLRESLKIGDSIKFKNIDFYINQYKAEYIKGELIYKYRFCRPNGIWQEKIYNKKLSGISLEGTVLEATGEILKLKLNIDEKQDINRAAWFTYAPPTGNILYSMPLVGDNVMLYFQNEYDRPVVTGCVRKNGATFGRCANPNNRYYATESGNHLDMLPGAINFYRGGMNVSFNDENGISFSSNNNLNIGTQGGISMSAGSVSISGSNKVIVSKDKGGFISLEGELYNEGTVVYENGSCRQPYGVWKDDIPNLGELLAIQSQINLNRFNPSFELVADSVYGSSSKIGRCINDKDNGLDAFNLLYRKQHEKYFSKQLTQEEINALPEYSSNMRYCKDTKVKMKGLDGEWYVGTAQVTNPEKNVYKSAIFVPNNVQGYKDATSANSKYWTTAGCALGDMAVEGGLDLAKVPSQLNVLLSGSEERKKDSVQASKENIEYLESLQKNVNEQFKEWAPYSDDTFNNMQIIIAGAMVIRETPKAVNSAYNFFARESKYITVLPNSSDSGMYVYEKISDNNFNLSNNSKTLLKETSNTIINNKGNLPAVSGKNNATLINNGTKQKMFNVSENTPGLKLLKESNYKSAETISEGILKNEMQNSLNLGRKMVGEAVNNDKSIDDFIRESPRLNGYTSAGSVVKNNKQPLKTNFDNEISQTGNKLEGLFKEKYGDNSVIRETGKSVVNDSNSNGNVIDGSSDIQDISNKATQDCNVSYSNVDEVWNAYKDNIINLNTEGKPPAQYMAEKLNQLNSQGKIAKRKMPNTITVLELENGDYLFSKNSEGNINKELDEMLDELGNENLYNRKCAEVNIIAKAMNKKVNLKGAKIYIAYVEKAGSKNEYRNGKFKIPCDVCGPMLNEMEIEVIEW